MTGITFRRAAALTFAAAMLGACSRQAETAAPGGDVLHVAVQSEPKSLNPLLASNTMDGFITRFMFEPLLSATPTGEPVPILATTVPTLANGGIARDGLTITYHLRPNAHWTDGVPVTAKDVRFSWQSIVNPNNNAVSRNGYKDVARIDVPDDRTAVVHLKKPFAPFVDTFFAESDQPYTIVPEHVLAKYPNVNQIPFDSAPSVSDGPFKFVSWSRGDRLELTANDGFFMGKPGLRGVVIRFVPNENTSIELLQTHEIDYMFQASIATYPALRAARGVRVVFANMNGYEGFGINTRRKPFDDPRVREAIAAGIDKAQLVRTLTYGNERVATGDIPDWMWAFDPALRSTPYNPAYARALLKAAGVTLPLHLVVVTESENVTHRREAVLLQSMLRGAGIDVEVKTYPADLLYAPAGMGGILNGGNFDASIWPWYGGVDPDNSSQFGCAGIPPNGWNEARFCNPEMERAQEIALTSYDLASRKKAYSTIESVILRDNPVIVFWWQRQLEALGVDLQNFTPNPTVESWNAWQWKL